MRLRAGALSSWLTPLALFAVFTALICVSVIMGGKEANPAASTHSAEPRGAKALYLMLEKSGVDVRRLERDFTAIPKDARVLVSIQPTYQPVSGELRGLKKWIRSGGILVISSNCTNPFLPPLGFSSACSTFSPDRVIGVTTSAGPMAGVRRVGPFYGVGAMEAPPETIPFIYRKNSFQLSVSRLGGGRIVFIATDEIFRNENISKYDNARLAGNLLGLLGKDEAVYFDEFHHGYAEPGFKAGFTMTEAIFGTPYGLFALQLLVAALLLFYNRDGLKTVEPKSETPPPSPVEFADAGARLKRRAGAHGHATVSMIEILRRETARRAGLPPETDFQTAVSRLPAGGDVGDTLLALARVKRKIESGHDISPAYSIKLAKAVEYCRKGLREKFHD